MKKLTKESFTIRSIREVGVLAMDIVVVVGAFVISLILGEI